MKRRLIVKRVNVFDMDTKEPSPQPQPRKPQKTAGKHRKPKGKGIVSQYSVNSIPAWNLFDDLDILTYGEYHSMSPEELNHFYIDLMMNALYA